MQFRFVVLAAFLFSLLVFGFPSRAQQPVIAPQSAQAPPAQWLADFDEFNRRNVTLGAQQKKNVDDFQRKTRKEVDALEGMSARLVRTIPQGYQFDSKLRLFLPLPRPAAVTPAPAPVPAPVPPTPATGEIK
jgi:hypothetical protein